MVAMWWHTPTGVAEWHTAFNIEQCLRVNQCQTMSQQISETKIVSEICCPVSYLVSERTAHA